MNLSTRSCFDGDARPALLAHDVSEAARSVKEAEIGLAPATFGSPVARMGRSWLGAIVKGNKEEGPDFLEAGDKVLDALELASPFTWKLAHEDLFCTPEFYGPDRSTPYVFIFCGTEMYGGFRRFVNSPGTDGTVRIAGCALNARKFDIDLSRTAERSPSGGDQRIKISQNKSIDFPVWPIKWQDSWHYSFRSAVCVAGTCPWSIAGREPREL